jgi:glutamate synthase domain-containing protein 3
MSGGIGYVLDTSGQFAKHCNAAMVDMSPVFAEGEQEAKLPRHLWHMGQADEVILRRMIERHAQYTGSQRAREILSRWNEYRVKFIKVFPKEYRRALGDLAAKGSKLAA